ncbi:hypothetical protein CPAV1605_119 [seawater metagenome]|uniref:Uncharacterized protein n=1 Tax=seawater metagenome TaxID=1561972 RepID=A0A5E8CH87_9ZZZZ
MYFCPKCKYILDLSKMDTFAVSNESNESKKKPLNNVSSIIKRIMNDDSLEDYSINIDLNTLEENSKYKKLEEEDRIKVYNAVSESLFLNKSSGSSGAGFICQNCGYSKDINHSLLLYSQDFSDSVEGKKYSPDDYKLIMHDYTLPRTRDYNCKNVNCITNDKKNEGKKEAVFFRAGNFDVTYVCTVCEFGWTF